MDLIRSERARRVCKRLLFVALAYAAIQVWAQAGFRTLVLVSFSVAGAAFLVAIVLEAFRYRISFFLIAGLLPLGLWIAVWGSYSMTRDMLGGALALTLAWPATRAFTHWRHTIRGGEDGTDGLDRPRRRFMRRYVVISFFFVWALNSTLDAIFESGAEPRESFPLAHAREPHAPWRDLRVGVSLSGGGYRAALMHAGVLAELDAMRIPITALSTVSGGSIVGSYYAAGGSPELFRDALAGGRLNLKRDMANLHNALRLPFPVEIPYLDVALFPALAFGRVDVQANLVDRVFLGGTRLEDLLNPGRPRLQVCATDLRSGAGVGLAADGIQLRSPPHPDPARPPGRIPYAVETEFVPNVDPTTRVADLVAASGAFPGAFNAVRLRLPEANGETERRFLLADGGIIDNWGVGLLLERYRRAPAEDPWRVDVLIVSAGGRIFEDDEDIPTPNQLRRAIDIIYETAGWHPIEAQDERASPPMLLLQPGDADRASSAFATFAKTTTLTDEFTRGEAQDLFELGRQLVRKSKPELIDLLTRSRARSAGNAE